MTKESRPLSPLERWYVRKQEIWNSVFESNCAIVVHVAKLANEAVRLWEEEFPRPREGESWFPIILSSDPDMGPDDRSTFFDFEGVPNVSPDAVALPLDDGLFVTGTPDEMLTATTPTGGLL